MSDAREPLVLCVDDDAGMLRALERTLREAGLDVRTASGGAEALALAAAEPPDLVLLDACMPGMDGYEVCRRLGQDLVRAVPVVFVTALDEESDRIEAMAAGAAAYLAKPFRDGELVEIVRTQLAAREKASDFARFKEFVRPRLRPGARNALDGLLPPRLYAFAAAQGLSGALMARWVAEFFRKPFLDAIDPSLLAPGVLTPQFSRANHVVALNEPDGVAFAVDNPFKWEVLELLRMQETDRVRVAEPQTFRRLFAEHDARQARPAAAADATQDAPEPPAADAGLVDVLHGDDAPAIRLVNAILADAVQSRASDVHIEPGEREIGVRFRIDGMLLPRKPLARDMLNSLVSRVKIMASLDIAERRVPQDGRIRILCDGRPVDLRVSTLPTRHGEKIVVRVLDKGAVQLDLETLGLEPEGLAAIRASIGKPHGILLVTGPTGSGKTTTLYAALNALNEPHANIVTVEDPVEYDLPRVNQVQVHVAAGLTFPVALRAILRQDPDIIMVGEIRDAETLDIAMKAALTGHLVLSTLHTNDSLSTIARLVDMGAEPFMVASTVEMISAQRLLRRLCARCKAPADVPPDVLARLGLPEDAAGFHRAVGCGDCNGAGYRGRIAIAEILVLDEELRQLVARSAPPPELREHAARRGMATLRRNALKQAERGLTSLEEVLRVTG